MYTFIYLSIYVYVYICIYIYIYIKAWPRKREVPPKGASEKAHRALSLACVNKYHALIKCLVFNNILLVRGGDHRLERGSLLIRGGDYSHRVATLYPFSHFRKADIFPSDAEVYTDKLPRDKKHRANRAALRQMQTVAGAKSMSESKLYFPGNSLWAWEFHSSKIKIDA